MLAPPAVRRAGRRRRATTGRPAASTPTAGARHHARGPVDPRLLHHARATRPYLLLSVVLGTVTALLIVAQAWLLATAVAGAFIDGKGLGDLGGAVWALLAVVVAPRRRDLVQPRSRPTARRPG